MSFNVNDLTSAKRAYTKAFALQFQTKHIAVLVGSVIVQY